MANYRVAFCRSSAETNEILMLSDNSPFPIWDSMDVVERVVDQLSSSSMQSAPHLPRPGNPKERANEVMQVLDALGIHFFQYVIEETGVRRTVRQSKDKCRFRK